MMHTTSVTSTSAVFSSQFAWFLCGFLVSLLWLNTSVTSLTCHFSICSKTANSNNRWRCDRFPWGNRTDCNGSNRICTTLSFRRDQGPLTGRGLRGSFRTQTCASSACDICTSHKYPNCAQRCCNTDLCNTAPGKYKVTELVYTPPD